MKISIILAAVAGSVIAVPLAARPTSADFDPLEEDITPPWAADPSPFEPDRPPYKSFYPGNSTLDGRTEHVPRGDVAIDVPEDYLSSPVHVHVHDYAEEQDTPNTPRSGDDDGDDFRYEGRQRRLTRVPKEAGDITIDVPDDYPDSPIYIHIDDGPEVQDDLAKSHRRLARTPKEAGDVTIHVPDDYPDSPIHIHVDDGPDRLKSREYGGGTKVFIPEDETQPIRVTKYDEEDNIPSDARRRSENSTHQVPPPDFDPEALSVDDWYDYVRGQNTVGESN